ncbi:MAG: MoaD/ThiS family protein [Novosphingobium sp.]
MVRVILTPPFPAEFFGGQDEHEVSAGDVFALVRALDAIAPGFALAADSRAAIAVNGVAITAWDTPLDPGTEVLFVTRIAGG